MCSEGSVHNFADKMKLLGLVLIIPPSTSGVEHGFSIMNLFVSPLCKSLSENNIDRLMHICLDGPEFLSKEQLEKIRHIHRQCSTQYFSVMFFVVIFYRYVFLSHVP